MSEKPIWLARKGDKEENTGYLIVRLLQTTTERDGLITRRHTTLYISEPLAVRRSIPVDTWEEGTAIYRDDDGQAYFHNHMDDEMVEYVLAAFSADHPGDYADVRHENCRDRAEADARVKQWAENEGDTPVEFFAVK